MNCRLPGDFVPLGLSKRKLVEDVKPNEIPPRPPVTPNAGLTIRQKEIYDFIRRYQETNRGMAPTFRDIGEAVGLRSSSTVASHLNTMRAKGYLKSNRGIPRSIILDTPSHVPADPAATALLHRWVGWSFGGRDSDQLLGLVQDTEAHIGSPTVQEAVAS